MCLFFVYLSMAYRVYSRFRVHMSIVSGIQRESGVFDNPIRSDYDRYIRVWTKSYFCFPLLSPPIFSGCRFDLATERDDRAIRLTGSGTGRERRHVGTKRRHADGHIGLYRDAFLPAWRVEGRGERTPATPVTYLQCQSLFVFVLRFPHISITLPI